MDSYLIVNLVILFIAFSIMITLLLAFTELKTIASYLKSLFAAVEKYQVERKWLIKWENETRGKRMSDVIVRRESDEVGEDHRGERT